MYETKPKLPLVNLKISDHCVVTIVNDEKINFLEYLNKVNIHIGSKIKVIDIIQFDKSLEIIVDKNKSIFISRQVAENILVTKLN